MKFLTKGEFSWLGPLSYLPLSRLPESLQKIWFLSFFVKQLLFTASLWASSWSAKWRIRTSRLKKCTMRLFSVLTIYSPSVCQWDSRICFAGKNHFIIQSLCRCDWIGLCHCWCTNTWNLCKNPDYWNLWLCSWTVRHHCGNHSKWKCYRIIK